MLPRMEPSVRIPSAAPGHVRVPPELEGLRRLAYNLYWTWHPKAKSLYARINSATWARTHSPIPVLAGMVDWAALLDNPDFMVEAQRVIADFDRYLANGADHWFHRQHASQLDGPIAYFCAEYGLHESLGIYSGGLGVLAGDHMKSASDMALPLVGVGCCTATATSARRSMPMATRSIATPTTTPLDCRSPARSGARATRSPSPWSSPVAR